MTCQVIGDTQAMANCHNPDDGFEYSAEVGTGLSGAEIHIFQEG